MKNIKRALSLLLVLCMLAVPALAVADESPSAPEAVPVSVSSSPSAWAITELFEAEVLSMLEMADEYNWHGTVTESALDTILAAVSNKVALLGLTENAPATDGLILDMTRAGVINALYQAAAAFEFPGLSDDPVETMASLNVLRGDGTGYALERECTLQEALVMGRRLVTAVYDACDAGSHGLLWKVSANGNTMYLLGTIHVDRSNVYPFHAILRGAIAETDAFIFEVDFGDAEGYADYIDLTTYDEGENLLDHLSDEAVEFLEQVCSELELNFDALIRYKPWALASSFQSALTYDDTTGDNPIVIDDYVYTMALLSGKDIGEIEGYKFQAELFDGLSAEYQEYYLLSAIYTYYLYATGELDEDYGNTISNYYDEMLELWKNSDIAGFTTFIDKEGELATGDELTIALYVERDANMISACDEYLKSEGNTVYMIVVGSGHMIGEGGIIQGLTELGYEVEPVYTDATA